MFDWFFFRRLNRMVRRKMIQAIFMIFWTIVFIIILVAVISRFNNISKTKIETPNGIQENTYVTIGGLEQYFQIRGEDKNNPVILWLHGGPGNPLTYVSYYYQTALEKDYTIVCWDQRGCGLTFFKNHDNVNLTAEQLFSDTDEIVDYLRERFNKEKIIIIGQSWGTVLGTEYLNNHPEKVAAYIGVGQVTDFIEMKIYAAEKATAAAEKKGKDKDVKILKQSVEFIEKLSETQSLQDSDIKSLEQMISTTSKYLKGDGEMSGIKQIWTGITSPDMSVDYAKWFFASTMTKTILGSQKNLVEYLYFKFDIMNLNREYDVPICFIQGENDFITPTDSVEEYYSYLSAEEKKMVIIKNAGHTPFMDNPEKFCKEVKTFLDEVAK